ncbi:hypothetical protein MNV49_005289 [Pseudohyphozyma bogoriensis]|nr:hypothetical protein MNV49_005289 [Pseudohyphozyma bogoriensis]
MHASRRTLSSLISSAPATTCAFSSSSRYHLVVRVFLTLASCFVPTAAAGLAPAAASTVTLPPPFHPYVHVPLSGLVTRPKNNLVPLPAQLFNTPSRPSLLHKLVVSHLASLRTGNASTKNRSQVNYSGKKLRPQKGTGRARLGSRGSPMLRGGGRAFGVSPKGPDGWKMKVNRKEEQLGLRVGLSEKWRSGNLVVVDRLGWEKVSTNALDKELRSRGWADALFITSADSARSLPDLEQKDAFVLSTANLQHVAVVEEPQELGIWEILKSKKVVMELTAVDEVIRRLDPENKLGVEDEEEGWEVELGGGEEYDELLANELEDALEGLDLGGVEQKL